MVAVNIMLDLAEYLYNLYFYTSISKGQYCIFSPSIINTVQTCPPVYIPENGSVNTTTAVYNTYVQVTCDDGFMFTPGHWLHTVYCQDNRSWMVRDYSGNDTLYADCSGM